jgi:inner membrane protein involved in colicin E2 resistance
MSTWHVRLLAGHHPFIEANHYSRDDGPDAWELTEITAAMLQIGVKQQQNHRKLMKSRYCQHLLLHQTLPLTRQHRIMKSRISLFFPPLWQRSVKLTPLFNIKTLVLTREIPTFLNKKAMTSIFRV